MPPSHEATTTTPPTTPPEDGLTLRTDTAGPRRKEPAPPVLKPSLGPTTPTDTESSPASPEGLSHRTRALDTAEPTTEDAESPKRHHAPAPTKPLPDTPTTVPDVPTDGDAPPTDGDATYWYTATVPELRAAPARTPTKPAEPEGATHTREPSPEDVPATTEPPKEQAPLESEEPITVTTPPPDTRPSDGSTDSATPPSTYSKDTPLELYSLSPIDTSTATRPAL